MKKRLLRVFLVLGGLALAGAFVVFVLRPPCLIRKFTGLYCPGCGGQRMLLALLQGDFSTAFRQNPFLFIVLPLTGVYAVTEAVLYLKQKRPLYKSRRFPVFLIIVLVAAVAYGILRNLPGLAVLRPI